MGSIASLECDDYTYRLFGEDTLTCFEVLPGGPWRFLQSEGTTRPLFPVCGGKKIFLSISLFVRLLLLLAFFYTYHILLFPQLYTSWQLRAPSHHG